MRRPTLLLLGHFPPPRGGIATHLDRLRDALDRENISARCVSFGNADATHPETLIAKNNPVAFFFAMLRGAAVLHYHTDESDWKSAALLGAWCLLRRQRYLLSVHSFRDHSFLKFGWLKFIVRLAYRRAEKILCISENLRTELLQRLPLPEANVIVVPSFLPVTHHERREPPPPQLETLLRRCPAIISFNAFATTMYNGEDLYGGDILLDAFAEIKDEFPEAGLMMVYLNFNRSPLAQLLETKSRALGDRVALIKNYDGSFIPVFTRSAVFVRATANDGGPSLSLLEALSLGVFSAASDAVPRPAECILFQNRNAHGLARALRALLQRVRNGEQQPPVNFPDAADMLVPLYRSFIR